MSAPRVVKVSARLEQAGAEEDERVLVIDIEGLGVGEQYPRPHGIELVWSLTTSASVGEISGDLGDLTGDLDA